MKTILVPIDFSPAATATVLAQAKVLARGFNSRLYLVHVAAPAPDFVGYDPGPSTVRDHVSTELHREHRLLHDLEEAVRKDGVNAVALLIQGRPVEKILQEAERLQADVIVMGTHGHSLWRELVGDCLSDGVLRKARCPVLLVPVPDVREAAVR